MRLDHTCKISILSRPEEFPPPDTVIMDFAINLINLQSHRRTTKLPNSIPVLYFLSCIVKLYKRATINRAQSKLVLHNKFVKKCFRTNANYRRCKYFILDFGDILRKSSKNHQQLRNT